MKPRLLMGKQTALQASVALVAMSLLSKLLGLGREMLVARNLGSSIEYDLFLTVFMLPTAVTTAISYTVSKAVTPYYQRARVEFGDAAANQYAWRITLVGSAGFVLLGALLVLAAPGLTRYLLPLANAQQLLTATNMFRVLAFLPLLFFWYASVGSFLRAERYFVASSLGALFQNILLIVVLWFMRDLGSWALVWSWVIALAAQAFWITAVHLATDHPLTLSRFPAKLLPRPYATGLLVAAVQIVFIELWGQLWTIADRFLAQYLALADGTIASLTYANALYVIPLSMFNLGIGRVVFPLLSGYVAGQNTQQTRRIIRYGLRSVCVVLIPITIYLMIESVPVVAALYQRGAFDAMAVETTALAVRWLVLALPLEGIYIILAALLYAQRDFHTLILSAVVGVMVKLIASYGLARGLGINGLALATSLASLVRLAVIVARVSVAKLGQEIAVLVIKVLGASLLAGGVAWAVIQRLLGAGWINTHLAGQNALGRVALGLVLFAAVYGVAGLALRIAEFRRALRWVRIKVMAP